VVNYKTFSLNNNSFSDIQNFYKTNKADYKTQILLENCDASHFNSLKNVQKEYLSFSVKIEEIKPFLSKNSSLSCMGLISHCGYDLYSKFI
jgi:hypothetical protein